MRALMGPATGAVGIALSGGGDSMALLHLAHRWGAVGLRAATVDHGLRPESAAEATWAGQAAARLGVAHSVLRWQPGPGGNLMAAAREARLRLLADWAREHRLDAVLLGHTRDDLAETLLMRLQRGAGVDGLAAMAAQRHACGMLWLRPLLGLGREALREWLRGQGIDWIEDPSNQNRDFERVRMRQTLADCGLSAAQMAQSAANLEMAREALAHFALLASQRAQVRAGSLLLPLTDFRAAPREIRRRLLVAGLRFVTGAPYGPRRQPLLDLLRHLDAGPTRQTLAGVIVQADARHLSMMREPAAALRAPPLLGMDGIWDGRWRVDGLRPDQQVRALGHGPLADLDWRASGLARDEAAASPGVWRGDRLLAAPALAPASQWGLQPLRSLADYHALLQTH